MRTEELDRWMQHPPQGLGSGPDLEAIRRAGRRRRRGRRAAEGAAVLVTVLALAGVWAALGPGGRGVTTVPASSPDHAVTSISAYERRVLAEVPTAYEVDGTVVLPDRAEPGLGTSLPPGVRLGDARVPLGQHGSVGPGYLMTSTEPKAFQENAPAGSQVVVDPGELWLGCLTRRDVAACEPAVMVRDTAGGWRFLHGFGTERFLQPGAPMELFLDDDFGGRTWHQSLLGGLAGTSIDRVVVTLVDGDQVEATVDAGRTRAGATLFWARLPGAAAEVTAYAEDGRLVALKAVRPCKDPVDCEVR